MTRDEFQTVLDESLAAFREEVKQDIVKATAPAPESDGNGAVSKADLEQLTADITEKFTAAMAPIIEKVEEVSGLSDVIDKVIDRLEGLAKRSVVKRSIDAQEGEGAGDGDGKLKLVDAFKAALDGRKVEIV